MLSCTSCNRHVRLDETTCPFCHASLSTSRSSMRIPVVAVAAGLALFACGDGESNDEFGGAAYGGPPPCEELDATLELELGDNSVDPALAEDDFTTSCNGISGSGPDLPLSFVAPAPGYYTIELDGITGWLVEYEEYGCYPWGSSCINNENIELQEGESISLMLDTTASTEAGTIRVIQE